MKYLLLGVIIASLYILLIYLAGVFDTFISSTPVNYLTKTQTAHFIISDADTYIASLSILDIYARQVKSHSDYRMLAAASSIDFTDTQKTRLDNATDQADAFFKTMTNDYIRTDLIQKIRWRFAMTSDANIYEAGFPHTREDIIFVTPAVIKSKDLIKTLIHEKIHLYQRKYRTQFQAVLKENGYTRVALRSTMPLIRANPDLDEYIYKNPKGVLMATVYTSSTPTSIMDTSTNNSTLEHPYEEIAYAIGESSSKSSIMTGG